MGGVKLHILSKQINVFTLACSHSHEFIIAHVMVLMENCSLLLKQD